MRVWNQTGGSELDFDDLEWLGKLLLGFPGNSEGCAYAVKNVSVISLVVIAYVAWESSRTSMLGYTIDLWTAIIGGIVKMSNDRGSVCFADKTMFAPKMR